MQFGERLRRLMDSAGKTRSDLAAECHVSRQTIHRWLQGDARPRDGHLIRLAEYFNVNKSLQAIPDYEEPPDYLRLELEPDGTIICAEPPISKITKMPFAGTNLYEIMQGDPKILDGIFMILQTGRAVYLETCARYKMGHYVTSGWWYPLQNGNFKYVEDYCDSVKLKKSQCDKI